MPVYKVIINAKNPNIIPGKMQLGLIEPLWSPFMSDLVKCARGYCMQLINMQCVTEMGEFQ
jgi:hypothetical protein